jgi:hypothetical protein
VPVDIDLEQATLSLAVEDASVRGDGGNGRTTVPDQGRDCRVGDSQRSQREEVSEPETKS